MADGEDASVEPMKTPSTYGPADSATRISERPGQLTYRDDPMLPIGEFRQRVMSPPDRVLPTFASHSGRKEGSASISPPYPACCSSRRGARSVKKPPALRPAAFGDA